MFARYKILFNSWLALTLSVLFFHPLIATLHDNIIILQWRVQNSLELISVIVLFTVILTVALLLIDKIPGVRLRFALLFCIFIVPFISFFIHFLQQVDYKNALVILGEYAHKNQLLVEIIVTFCGAVFLVLAARYTSKMTHVIIILILILSPLNLLAGWTLWSIWDVNTKIDINTPNLCDKKTHTPDHNLIIILFDSLSYEYLYKNASVSSRYTNFHRLSSISDNYHNALSPGKQTLTAIPGLLTGKSFDNVLMGYRQIYKISKENKKEYLDILSENLFSIAKKSGYKTFLFGSYLPYCEMFDRYLNRGHSFSIYNYAGVETHFSLLSPIMTNLIIWPRQSPQGFIKNIVVSQWQKEQTIKVFKFSMAALDEKNPFFLFTHIYSTHVPLVFDRNGYFDNKEPFLQSAENYTKAVEFADYTLGELIRKMEKNTIFESSEVIVLSDHNNRSMFPGKENHIPLIIKKPFQQIKNDLFGPVHTEGILNEIMKKNSTIKINANPGK